MTQRYLLDWALLPQGWARDVALTVAQSGLVTALEIGPAAQIGVSAERVAGFTVPGVPNAHSHAFQRALAGGAEYRASARDSFWTWRRAMYALANRIEPEDLEVIATQLFIEMLKAGYTSVAEFHYLHRPRDATQPTAAARHPGAAPSPGNNALWEAVRRAARASGIGLTLLPTLYQTADFGGEPLRAEQMRFRMDSDEFLRAVEERIAADRRDPCPTLRTGAAFHSLRAVPMETLRETASQLRRIDATMPVHIHVAEQLREVQACKRATGLRPIESLLRSGLLDERWCLVHCTHATREELAGIAASRATVCVSISTEANLGDGLFDALGFLRAGGRLCIGSDSQSTVDPAEELRWLEYQQRLRRRRRIVLATATEPHVGTRLWRAAAAHGAQALGQPVGEIAVGRRADWIVLDGDHPSMAGARPESALDHLIFAGGAASIRDCMVAGRWVVKDRRHAQEAAARERFTALLRRASPPPIERR